MTKTQTRPVLAVDSRRSQNTDFDFEDPRYESNRSTSLPYAQVINPAIDLAANPPVIKPYGYAITQANAEAIGFTPDESWQFVERYKFQSGDASALYLTQSPRLLVIRSSEVFLRDRDTQEFVGTLAQHRDRYNANRQRYKTFNHRLILFLDQNNQPLHRSPLQLTLSGAAGATFADHFAKYERGRLAAGFCRELAQAYSDHRHMPYRDKGELFSAHGVFQLQVQSQKKGEGTNTGLVSSVVGHDIPTPATLSNLLISPVSELGQLIQTLYEDYPQFGKHSESSLEEFNQVVWISEVDAKYHEDGSLSSQFLMRYWQGHDSRDIYGTAAEDIAEQVAGTATNQAYRVTGKIVQGVVQVTSFSPAAQAGS
jgi:hypothetical protein